MTQPVLKRRSLLVLTALLVVTAAGAAAPMRNVWLPIAARPLGLWGNATTPTPAGKALYATTAAAAVTDGDLDALLTKAPERLDFIAAPLAPDTKTRSRNNEATGWSGDSGSSNGNRYGWYNGNSRRYGGGVGGPSVPYGGGGTAIGLNGSNKSDASSSGSSNSSGNGSSWGGGSGGGSSLDDLFKEHDSSLATLTGGLSAGSSPFASSAGSSNLASSPEPSTLLLLGTGLAALAGSMRRRLR